MAGISVSDVVLVRFPFSDLQGYKLRPALVLAKTAHADFVLCQITSRPFADDMAVEITSDDFERESLNRTSYVRVAKLFTANDSIITRQVGQLKPQAVRKIRTGLAQLFQMSDFVAPGTSQ